MMGTRRLSFLRAPWSNGLDSNFIAGFYATGDVMSSLDGTTNGTSSSDLSVAQLVEEKSALQAQNAQLWRLVDKQRNMIQGLQRDLEKATTASAVERPKHKNESIPPANVPYPTTPRKGDSDQRMPVAPEVVDDCDDTSITTDHSPETFTAPPSASRQNLRNFPRPLDFGRSQNDAAGGEELPIKSPLRSASSGRIPSLNGVRDNASKGDGSSSPMSPALSLRMQQIPRTASPLASGHQQGRVGIEEVERVNMPRRERVRTSSQKSVSQVSSPRFANDSFDQSSKGATTPAQLGREPDLTDKELQRTYFAELETSTQATLSPTLLDEPVVRSKTPDAVVSDARIVLAPQSSLSLVSDMVRSGSGGALADIASQYYSESTSFLPLPKATEQSTAVSTPRHSTLPAKAKFAGPDASPESIYDSFEDLGHYKAPEHTREPAMALEPAVEFFLTPSSTTWQEQSPERERQSSTTSMLSESTFPSQVRVRDSFEPLQQDPCLAESGAIKILMLDSSTPGSIELGVYQENSILLHKLHKSLSDLLLLERRLHERIEPGLPRREEFESTVPSRRNSCRIAVDLWFVSFQQRLIRSNEQDAARSFSRFLQPEALSEREGSASLKLPESELLNSRSASISSTRYADMPETHFKTPKEGFLRKRGKNFGGWKMRFFVLDGPIMKYYETPGGSQLGTIRLPQAQIGSQQPSDNSSSTNEKDGTGLQHAFMILEPKKRNTNSFVRHVLCASSDSERDGWIKALLLYVNTKPGASESDTGPSEKSDTRKFERSDHSVSTPIRGTRLDMHGSSPIVAPGHNFTAISYGETIPGRQPPFDALNQFTPRATADLTSPRPIEPDVPTVSISRPMNGAPIENSTAWGATTRSSPAALPSRLENPVEKKAKKKSFWNFGKGDHNASSATRDAASVRSPSSNDLSFVTQMGSGPMSSTFGMPLAEAVQIARDRGMSAGIPIVVSRCIDYLDVKHAEREEGIYRLSGSNTVIKGLKERFNNEIDINLVACGEFFDIHAIAGLLKLYLRELPSSMLTRDLQRDFLDIIEMPEGLARMVTVRTLVHSLPKENFELLRVLSRHLGAIVSHSELNKMTLRNVGIVFSPTLNIPAAVFSLFIAEYDLIFNDREMDSSRILSPRPQTDSNSIRSTRSNNPTASVYLDTEQSYHLLQHNYEGEVDESQPYGMSEYRPSNLSHS